MNRPRLIRGLRIAWTVGCGILCVLLVVLWMRSYWYSDHLARVRNGDMYGIESACGSIRPFFTRRVAAPSYIEWLLLTEPLADTNRAFEHPIFGWDAGDYPDYFMAYLPHWLPAMLLAAVAAIPWVRWSRRFSVRTLLIATTLIAIVLGLVVWTFAL
jgi:hypothetical protein